MNGYSEAKSLRRMVVTAMVVTIAAGAFWQALGASSPGLSKFQSVTLAPPVNKVITPAARCAALEKQLGLVLRNGVRAHAVEAKRLAREGEDLCERGKHATGALRLVKALALFGLKPEEPTPQIRPSPE